MGHGTIGGNVTDNGTVQPGGTIGVLTVGGNYAQNAGNADHRDHAECRGGGRSRLQPAQRWRHRDDREQVPALSIIEDPGTYSLGRSYTILTAAGGVSGRFGTASIANDPGFAAYITPYVSYDATDVFVSLEPTPGTSGPFALFNSGQEDPDVLTAMVSAMDGVGDAVLGDVCGPTARRMVSQGEGCVVRPLAAGYQSEVWMRGLGGLGSLSGGGSRMSLHDDYGGMLIGAGVSRGGFTIGAGGGYLATSLSFSDGSNAQQNAGLGFVYGRYAQGPMWFGVMAAYGGGQVDGQRALPGTGLTASGNRSADFGTVRARAAYDVAVGAITIEPRADLAYIHAGESGFARSGAGLLDLAYAGTNADVTEGRLTVRAMQHIAAGRWGLVPWVEAGVQQSFSGLSRSVVVTDGPFSSGVAGVSPAPTAAVIGIGVSAAATDALDVFVRYQGQFSADQTENAFSAGLAFRF